MAQYVYQFGGGRTGRVFHHVKMRVPNNRPGCHPGSTADFLVSFASVVVGAFAEDPSLCQHLEVASTTEPLRDFNAGWLLSAAGTNGGPASRTPAGAALRRYAADIDRDLRLEMRRMTVMEEGSERLRGVCGGRDPRERASQLAGPLAFAVGIPAALALVLAAVYPALLWVVEPAGGRGGGGVRNGCTGGTGGGGAGRRPRARTPRDGTARAGGTWTREWGAAAAMGGGGP